MRDKRPIGKVLRTIRLASGMSCTDLAKAMGIVVSHVSDIETGKRTASLETLRRICEALEINEKTLFSAFDIYISNYKPEMTPKAHRSLMALILGEL